MRRALSPQAQNRWERRDVTVCVATLFFWNYGSIEAPQLGRVAVTLSDRKITAFDTEYEPNQLKVAFITPRALVLVAGDMTCHSEAIALTNKQVKGVAETAPENIALIYGQAIQTIRRRQGEDLYLAPIGLNTDTFLAQQRDLDGGFVDRITNQLQTHRGPEVEALVVGADGIHAHIYEINEKGSVACLDDIGFGAIGIGAWHARSRLMQLGYVNKVTFGPAITSAYASKRAAEAAPGVGSATDIHIVFNDHIEPVREDVSKKAEELWENYRKERLSLEVKTYLEMEAFIKTVGGSPTKKDAEN